MGRSRIGLAVLCGLLVACGEHEPRPENVDRQPAAEELPVAAEPTRNRGDDVALPEPPVVDRAELERWLGSLVEDGEFEGAVPRLRAAGAVASDLLYEWLLGDDVERHLIALALLPSLELLAVDGAVSLLANDDLDLRIAGLEILTETASFWSRSERARHVATSILALLAGTDEELGPAPAGGTVLSAAMRALHAARPALAECADEIAARLRSLDLPRDQALAKRLVYLAGLTTDDAAASTVPLVLDLLASGDPTLQKVAADALKRSRPTTREQVATLLPLLRDGSRDQRKRALDILYMWGEDAAPAVDALREVALDESLDENLRDTALRALARMPSVAARVLPDLLTLLVDADPSLRHEAAQTLTRLRDALRPLVPELVAETTSATPARRVALLHALRIVAEPLPIATFHDWLRDPDPAVRGAAIDLLDAEGSEPARRDLARGVLRPMARDPDPYVRVAVAAGLGDVPTMLAGIEGGELHVQRRAVQGLRYVERAGPDVVEAVRGWRGNVMDDADMTLATRALIEIAPVDEQKLETFLLIVEGPEYALLDRVLEELPKLGPKGEVIAPAVADLLRDPEYVDAAVATLAAMGDVAASDITVERLMALVDEREAPRAALRVLTSMGPAAAAAELTIREYIMDGHPSGYSALAAVTSDHAAIATELVKRLARTHLERVRPLADAVLAALLELGAAGRDAVLAGLRDDELRAAAVLLLEVLPRADLEEHLRAAFADDDADVRAAAAIVLERLAAGGFDATPFGPALVRIATDGSDAAIRLLGRIRPVPNGTLSALRGLLRSPSNASRVAAAGALFRVTGEVQPSLATFAAVLEINEDDDWDRIGIYLAEMGPRAAPIAATINATLLRTRETMPELVRAIGTLGDGAAPCLPALRAALEAPISDLGQTPSEQMSAAIESARRLGPIARSALPELRELLDDELLDMVFARDGERDVFVTAVRGAIKATEAE